jgi:CubicO group peptidase (beta-lactamase class C family)
MRKLPAFLIIALIALSCAKKKPNYENIGEIVKAYASNDQLNGSILIAQKNNIIYQESFGLANIETKTKITSSTLFPLCSVTKQFTATAIMILQEKGMLSIDDKISKYMEVPPTLNDIPIKNFMNMTSGIFNYWENNVKNNKDSILKFHYESEALYFPTNTKYHYNNSNYFFLGLLIESVSGMTYNDFLSQNIFEPAGMSNTFLYEGNKCNKAIGYDETWNINDYLITTADGGILSTIDNLFLWDKALSENKILTSASKTLMFETSKLENGEINNYGFGWEINVTNENNSLFHSLFSKFLKDPKNDNKVVSHTGSLASFGAYNQYDVNNDYYIILLSNQLRPELMHLIKDINSELYKTQ